MEALCPCDFTWDADVHRHQPTILAGMLNGQSLSTGPVVLNTSAAFSLVMEGFCRHHSVTINPHRGQFQPTNMRPSKLVGVCSLQLQVHARLWLEVDNVRV